MVKINEIIKVDIWVGKNDSPLSSGQGLPTWRYVPYRRKGVAKRSRPKGPWFDTVGAEVNGGDMPKLAAVARSNAVPSRPFPLNSSSSFLGVLRLVWLLAVAGTNPFMRLAHRLCEKRWFFFCTPCLQPGFGNKDSGESRMPPAIPIDHDFSSKSGRRKRLHLDH